MFSKGSWALAAVTIALATLAMGCAEEREPINRVQADALHKSFFVGESLVSAEDDPEFYAATTVVDVPFGADQGFVFPGFVGDLKRIKWEIAEDILIARLTYETIDGIDGHGSRTTNDGKVIASFKIEKHFDIRHSYNPSTGEELNVIEENTSDRPWYQREYFRVNWSKSGVVTNLWDPLALDDYDTEPLEYYVNDPSHPDAPVFDVKAGYFDITNKLFLSPKMLDLGSGEFPACFYRGSLVIGATYPWGNCDSSEITIRRAFRKVAQEGEEGFTDYEPKNWDGARFDGFGAFVVERLGWDNRYGIVDHKWHRFIQRYNIWEKSHSEVECGTPETTPPGCDPNRDGDADCDGVLNPGDGEIADGTADECISDDVALWGSQCNPYTNRCTIPYAQREVKPIVWHYTIDADDDVIFESTEYATYEWDTAMREAVQVARYTECVRTFTASVWASPWTEFFENGANVEKSRELCGEAFPMDNSHDEAQRHQVLAHNLCIKGGKTFEECATDLGFADNTVAAMEPTVILCASPVPAGAPPECGPAGTVARPGDIRFHTVNVWPTRQSISPWGYGPSLGDPLTGEIISAGINVYNAPTDSITQSYIDQLRWMNGELSVDDITTGQHVQEWGEAAKYNDTNQSPLIPKEVIAKKIAGITGVGEDAIANSAEYRKTMDTKHLVQSLRELDSQVMPGHAVPVDKSIFDDRIRKAKESGIEAKLMGPMWLQMAGVPPGTDPDTTLEMASPLRGMRSTAYRELYDQLQQRLADRGQCIYAAQEPTSLPALAKIIDKKFPYDNKGDAKVQGERLNKMWDYLRFKLHLGVMIHEMGHTFSLRHNFVSSYDKYNYMPQYWQLRTETGSQEEACTGPVADGDECLGPRYYDPVTAKEHDNLIWTWMYTSVMDYDGEITQGMNGLGSYDMAATRMFYADVVDVRDDEMVEGTPVGDEVINLVDYPGYLFGQVVFDDDEGFIHQTQYNRYFQLNQADMCEKADTSAPPHWREDDWGKFDAVFDGHIINGERCRRPDKDYMVWKDMQEDRAVVDFDDDRFFTPRRAKDIYGRARVPYGFLTDGYADGWSVSAFRHDNGADMYEEVLFHSNLYENRHIFENFRNGRVNFTIYGAYARAISRYHNKIANLTQGFSYGVDFILRDFARNTGQSFPAVIAANVGPGSFLYDHAVAAAAGMDHFTRVLTRPHTGAHYRVNAADRVLRPADDEIGLTPSVLTYMPNGNSTAGGSLSHGGRPLNNSFDYGEGYWAIDYLSQAGSYYEKTFAFERMLESYYGAIAFYRFDGLDARFRHVHFGDLFPEGIRRLIGVSLTEDHELLGARMSSNDSGQPATELDADTDRPFPADPLAWVSYVPDSGPVACAPVDGVISCTDSLGTPIVNGAPTQDAWFIDPQLGYEVQKFIVFWSYVYLPGGEIFDWVDQMRIYKLGDDNDPNYLPEQIVEWRDPESGLRYLARRFGDEQLFTKTYDKGIAAKMIQWANQLTGRAYLLDQNVPYDPVTGAANVRLDPDGQPYVVGGSCENNIACQQLRKYRGLLDFTRDTAAALGFPEPNLQIFGD